MISMFALIICLGIMVDDAIVVGEHAHYLHLKGHSAFESAFIASKTMFFACILFRSNNHYCLCRFGSYRWTFWAYCGGYTLYSYCCYGCKFIRVFFNFTYAYVPRIKK